MAFIKYLNEEEIDPADVVADTDNILRIHSVHSRVMRLHFDLYVELMRGPGPLSTIQRESIGVVVSAINSCRY